MPVLEFLLKFKPCPGIFADSGNSKARHVLDWSDMEVSPSPPPPRELLLDFPASARKYHFLLPKRYPHCSKQPSADFSVLCILCTVCLDLRWNYL